MDHDITKNQRIRILIPRDTTSKVLLLLNSSFKQWNLFTSYDLPQTYDVISNRKIIANLYFSSTYGNKNYFLYIWLSLMHSRFKELKKNFLKTLNPWNIDEIVKIFQFFSNPRYFFIEINIYIKSGGKYKL